MSHRDIPSGTDAVGAGDSPPKAHSLGILLVHGIGEQPRGGTLLDFGEPLIRGLQRWFGRPDPGGTRTQGRVEVLAVHPGKGDEAPAYAELSVVDRAPAPPTANSWLVAEHWWASSVHAPNFNRLAAWMFTKGVAVIFIHLTKRLHLAGIARSSGEPKRMREGLRTFAACVRALLATLLLQLAVAALFVLALLPIPRLRDLMSRLLLALSSVLGDSYVFVESQLQRAALLGSTRRAMAWLSERCERVVVVAHSQGAAIAHHAMRSERPEAVASLITFGSGLEKVETLIDLGEVTGKGRGLQPWMVGPFLLLMLLLGAQLVRQGVWEDPQTMAGIAVVVFLLGAFAFARHFGESHWKAWVTRADRLRLETSASPLRWVDITSTNDPVPNGPLVTARPNGRDVGVRKVEVANGRGVMQDHTAYWANLVEFVPAVVDAICRVGGMARRGGDDRLSQRRAITWHRAWLPWRRIERASIAVTLLLVFFRFGDALQTWGGSAVAAIQRAPWPIATLFEAVTPFDGAITAGERALWHQLTALVPVLFAMLAGHRVFEMIWTRVDGRYHERALGWPDLHGTDALMRGFAIAAALAPLVAVLLIELVGLGQVPRLFGRTLALLTSLACLAGAWSGIRRLPDARALRGDARLRELMSIAGTVGGAVFLSLFMLSFVVTLPRVRDVFVAGLAASVGLGFIANAFKSMLSEVRARVTNPAGRFVLIALPFAAAALVILALSSRVLAASRAERVEVGAMVLFNAVFLAWLTSAIVKFGVRRITPEPEEARHATPADRPSTEVSSLPKD